MATPQAPTMFRDLWKTVLALGVLTLILGVLVLVWPGISILVAAVLFGAFLVVSGIAVVVGRKGSPTILATSRSTSSTGWASSPTTLTTSSSRSVMPLHGSTGSSPNWKALSARD
jgi:hypothetical protein